MGFREGAFATVWEITNHGDSFSKVRVSTSRKDKKTDEYVTCLLYTSDAADE